MTLFEGANNWRAGMQEVSAAIDETMGELVKVMQTTSPAPNFPSVAVEANAVTVTAVFTSKTWPVLLGENFGRLSSGHSISPIVSTSELIFSFGHGVLPFSDQARLSHHATLQR